MRTADDVEITDGLRLWTGRLDPATADLATRGAGRAYADGWLVVHTDAGRTVMIDAESTAAAHPATGEPPPPLGGCRWVLACARDAVRMQPHPLMSPVPVCAPCIQSFHLS